MPELWNLYDGQRQDTGLLHERGKRLPDGFYHLVVQVWLINRQGQCLMSRRHEDKPFPRYWESTGGSVLAGEDSLHGAIREVQEELGLAVNSASGRLISSQCRESYHDFLDVWLFPAEVTLVPTLAYYPDVFRRARQLYEH